MDNEEDQACQGCDYIEAPVLDAGAKFFAEQLRKKHEVRKEQEYLESKGQLQLELPFD